MAEQAPKIETMDGILAWAASAGSALQTTLPKRLQFISKSDLPSYVPVRWRHAHRLSAGSSFMTIEREDLPREGSSPHGNKAGRTPRNYGQAAILLIDR